MDWLTKSLALKRKQSFKHSHTNLSCKPFPFSKEQVRVLLYRDCDWRGRKLLFDSTAVRKIALARTINSTTRQHFTEVLDGFGYKFLNKNSDTLSIAEMIFGTVAMAYKGTSLKIHWLSCPSRLLCTQVFVSPLATPMVSNQGVSSCSSLNTTFTRDTSTTLNTSTLDSLYSTYTTISSDAGLSTTDSGYVPSQFRDSEISLSKSDVLCNKTWDGKHTKLGLAVCVTLTESLESEMQYYYMEHIPLIESMMNRLQFTVKQAYIEKLSFFSALIKAFEAAAQFIYDLFRGPSIIKPFRVALASSSHGYSWDNISSCFSDIKVENSAQNFIDRLYKLLNAFDTKGTNFFISTLITAILTHHLGWVDSIAPNKLGKSRLKQPELSCCSQIDKICNCCPINALCAQLGDLYGVHGYPIKICKTLISCSDANVANEIITVLTYFIRCRNINRVFIKPIFENSFSDDVMSDKYEDVQRYYVENNNIDQIGNEISDFNMNLELCESKRELDNKEYLIYLRKCNQYLNQIWKYISLNDERSKKYLVKMNHCDNKNQILYDSKFHVNDSKKNNSKSISTGLKWKNKESYLDLTSLIAKTSIDNCSSELYGNDYENEEGKSNVNFVLGDKEALKTNQIHLNSLNKIMPETIIDERCVNDNTKNILEINSNNYKNMLRGNILQKHGSFYEKTPYNQSDNGDLKLLKKIITLPLLKSQRISSSKNIFLKPAFPMSLLVSTSDHYVPDMVLQGTTASLDSVISHLSENLALSTALFDTDMPENVNIIANIEDWKIKSISSQTNLMTNRISSNIMLMSRLVSNMMEVVQQMRRLKISADYCVKYIERKLFEMYLKSKTLTEMLKATDFCELSWITSSLGIEVADMPLLMSIASTHSPHVLKKYSLNYR